MLGVISRVGLIFEGTGYIKSERLSHSGSILSASSILSGGRAFSVDLETWVQLHPIFLKHQT